MCRDKMRIEFHKYCGNLYLRYAMIAYLVDKNLSEILSEHSVYHYNVIKNEILPNMELRNNRKKMVGAY